MNLRQVRGKNIWKTIAITDQSPKAFASSLEKELNALSKDGFEVFNMIHRGRSVIIVALRQEPPSTEEIEAAIKEGMEGLGIHAPIDQGKLS